MEKLMSGKAILKQVQEKVEAERNAKAEKQAKRQRVIFIRRMVAVSFLMIGMFTMFSFANDLFDKEEIEKIQISAIEKQITEYEQVEVFIQEGDTAWDIQNKLTPGKDMRDMLDIVMYINKRDSIGDIKAGEVLTFVKEKESK